MKLEMKQEKWLIFERKNFGLKRNRGFRRKKFQGEAELKREKVAAKNKLQDEAKLKIWSRNCQLFPKISKRI